MNKCPYCGRDNSADAAQCHECGTPFATGRAAASPQRTSAEKRMLNGSLWCGGGIFVTVITYAMSANGGTYVVAWGAIVFGGLQFFQGLRGRVPNVRRDDSGYAALEYGTKLETQGRVQEALEIYQAIIDKYPRTDAAKDAKNSLDGLKGRLG
jgi:hypothetical protein